MASVTKDGRIVLYYVKGKPVYADTKEGFTSREDDDRIKNLLDDRRNDFKDKDKKPKDKKSDDDTGGDRNKDKPDKKKDDKKVSGQKLARPVFVRGSNGRLMTQYVDATTGKKLQNLEGYTLYSQNTVQASMDEIYGRNTTKTDTDTNTDDEDKVSDWAQIRLNDGSVKVVSKEWLKTHPGVNVINNNYFPPDKQPDSTTGGKTKGTTTGTKTSTNTTAAASTTGEKPTARTTAESVKNVGTPSEGFTANTQTDSQPEQGDTTDDSGFGDLGKNIYNPGSESVTGRTIRSVDYPSDQVHTIADGTTVPVDAKQNETGFYTTGKNFHDFEGTDLSKVKTSAALRGNYTDADIQAMAKTLAGEIDMRYTDPNSEEGKREIGAILSTMENRDLTTEGGVIDVVSAEDQYSANNPGMRKTTAANFNSNPEGWVSAVKSYLSDPTSNQGFTHYRNPSLVKPGWSTEEVNPIDIGPHRFSTLTTKEYMPDESVYGPLSQDEQGQLAGKIIDRNALQSFAAPASIDITASPPTTGFYSTDMAAGMQAQRDYTPAEFTGVQANDSNFASGVNAQRDYTGFVNADIQKSNRVGTDGFTNADIQKSGRVDTPQSRMNVSSINDQVNATSFDQGMQAQRDYTPAEVSSIADSSFAAGLQAQRDYTPPAQTDMTSMADGIQAQRDSDGFANVDVQKSNRVGDDGFVDASIQKSNRQTPGFDVGRFGTNVTTDANAVNGTVNSPNVTADINAAATQGFVPDASADITSSPPSGFTAPDTNNTGTNTQGSQPSDRGTTPGDASGVTGDTGFSGQGDPSGPGFSSETPGNTGSDVTGNTGVDSGGDPTNGDSDNDSPGTGSTGGGGWSGYV